MTILFKVIYIVNEIPIKLPIAFIYMELEQQVLKSDGDTKDPKAKAILRKMHWLTQGLRIVDFRWNQVSLWRPSILRETSF